jgi:hypothetical protein
MLRDHLSGHAAIAELQPTHRGTGGDWGWPPSSVQLEAIVRFPWSGGCHPCLDVLVEAPTALIGIESKRYEPFRAKPVATLSEAYWRPVWGDRMAGYARVRDGLRDGEYCLQHLDGAQLIKHAFGLRTAANKQLSRGLQPVLLYLYAEPDRWSDGRPIPLAEIETHRQEIATFSDVVASDEVAFYATTYRDMLRSWDSSPLIDVRQHVDAVRQLFHV